MAMASKLPDMLNYSSRIVFPSNRVRFPITDSVSSLSYNFEKLSLSSKCKVVCRSTYNVQVIVADNEAEERLVNRFRREVLRAGIIQESKRRRFFENSQAKRKRKARDAARRNRKRRRPVVVARAGFEEEEEKKKKDGWYDEAEDNWELPPDMGS